MLEALDTLVHLSREGTMTRTATVLRVGQSTVSKRIAALEAQLGYDVVERDGRRVRLTAEGSRLVDRTAPLLAQLKAALADEPRVESGTLVVGVSESILASWGPELLRRSSARVDDLTLELHAHRSPVAIERVRAGEYALALVAGRHERTPDLVSEHLLDEQMVVIPSGLGPLALRRGASIDVIAIETHAATWTSLRSGLARVRRERGIHIDVVRRVESFTAIAQMAKSGLGNGLVPAGIARALAIRSKSVARFPGHGLTRPVSLVGRPTTFQRPLVDAFRRALSACVGGGS